MTDSAIYEAKSETQLKFACARFLFCSRVEAAKRTNPYARAHYQNQGSTPALFSGGRRLSLVVGLVKGGPASDATTF